MARTLRLLSAAIFGAVGLTSMAQCPGSTEVSIFSSDFETDNGGLIPTLGSDWEYGEIPVIVTGANCESATFSSPGGANSGTKGWATLLNDCYHNQNPSAFNTLNLDVDLSDPDYLSARLDFAQWFEVFTNFDYLVITANGTEIYRNDTTEDSNTWLETSVDLTPYLGQSLVTLSFKLWATTVVNRVGWYLDDVSVMACSSSTLSIHGATNAGFNMWPIPATDKLNIQPSTDMGATGEWTLYDATGRVLANGQYAGSGPFSIDVSNFRGPGVLEMRNASGSKRQTVMME